KKKKEEEKKRKGKEGSQIQSNVPVRQLFPTPPIPSRVSHLSKHSPKPAQSTHHIHRLIQPIPTKQRKHHKPAPRITILYSFRFSFRSLQVMKRTTVRMAFRKRLGNIEFQLFGKAKEHQTLLPTQ